MGSDRVAARVEGVWPVQRRVGVLARFWWEFDALHAGQVRGRCGLWGLAPGYLGLLAGGGGYRELLSSGLVGEIDELWGGSVLVRWPDRIVTSADPYMLMADAFGPALGVWSRIGLAAWSLCEDPTSAVCMRRLEGDCGLGVGVLERAGFGVGADVFEDLRLAEARLVPRSRTAGVVSVSFQGGVGGVVSRTVPTRRGGFEGLRDVITWHRRRWARRHLAGYLASRWQDELSDVAGEYQRVTGQRGGVPPTGKQFAKHMIGAANHWCGGDLRDVYAAIDQPAALHPSRRTLVPDDRQGFVTAVTVGLGGRLTPPEAAPVTGMPTRGDLKARERHARLRRLGEDAIRYLQLFEARGRPPTLEEFGRLAFQRRAEELWPGFADHAWHAYTTAIDQARTAPTIHKARIGAVACRSPRGHNTYGDFGLPVGHRYQPRLPSDPTRRVCTTSHPCFPRRVHPNARCGWSHPPNKPPHNPRLE